MSLNKMENKELVKRADSINKKQLEFKKKIIEQINSYSDVTNFVTAKRLIDYYCELEVKKQLLFDLISETNE